MGALKKLAGQTVIYGISSIVGRVINLVLVPLHTRVLLTGQYGIVSYFFTQTAFLNVVLTFGMETTFFRFVQDKENPQDIFNQAFSWVLLLSSILLLVLLPFTKPIASFLQYPEYHQVLVYVGIIIALDAIAALPMAMLRHQERPLLFAGITLSSIFINIILNLIFFLVLGKDSIEYVFIANVAGSAVKMVLALSQNLPSKIIFRRALLRPMLPYGGFIMLAGLAGTANQSLDRLMIPYLWKEGSSIMGSQLLGDEMLGIYQACYKLAFMISLFTQAYRYAAEPFFFRSAEEKDSPKTFARVFHYYTLATLTGFLFIGSFAQEFVSFDLSFGLSESAIYFIDEPYWLGLVVVPILLFAYVFHGMYFNFSIWFKITKQTRFALLFTGTGAVCAFLINFFGIPQYGFYASAWGALFCFALMAFLAYVTGQRHYPIPYRMGRIGLYIGIFLIAFGINYQIGPVDGFALAFWWKLIVCLLCLGCVFLIEKSWPIRWAESQA